MSAWDLPRTRARKQLPEALATGVEAAMQRGVEPVRVQGIGEPVAQPRGHAGSAGAEQEAARFRHLEESTLEFHIESRNRTRDSGFHSTRTRNQSGPVGRASCPRSSLPSESRNQARNPHPSSATVRVHVRAIPSADATGAG